MEADPPESANVKGHESPFTPAERIAELNAIDQSISTLLSAASDVIGILSNEPSSETQERALRNPTSARSAFQDAASTYFTTLSSIDVRLRRQVYALEEAGLVKPGDDRDPKRGRKVGGEYGIERTGGGPLDPSWLSARASDKVGSGMKAELLAQARVFIEKSEGRSAEKNLDENSTDLPRSTSGEDRRDHDVG
ncbi:hypothetical protein PV10_04068 [Exophiala mesophila]|uniref:Mediator of RNA polymerase II transcription subunit 11 n=1 Tax=Exophiala mesophila TaxID=212818 RepID=A0A0D1ZDL2_EXOME|nr:uncharacterized protein PV10_04068 [Exophiala mesophila]KIV92802.1 hypothetical protein PV10_04068 [Exophiala mesophila]